MKTTEDSRLDFIRQKSKDLGITAYEFSENTQLSAVGAHNILTGSSKNPRTRNLNMMMDYIVKKLNKATGTKVIPGEDPFKEAVKTENSLEDEVYNIVMKRLQPQLDEQKSMISDLRNDFKLLFDQCLHILNNNKEPYGKKEEKSSQSS